MNKHLLKIVDFALKKGYTIKFSPKRKRATFKHKRKGIVIETELYWDKEDQTTWVWFDFNGGMSGNDPVHEFVYTFKEMHKGDPY